MTPFGKWAVGAVAGAAVIGAALAYWRSGGAGGELDAGNAVAMVFAIVLLGGVITYSLLSSRRQHADENATVEASNVALRSIAASTGLSYRETQPYEHPVAGRFLRPATVAGTYLGVELKIVPYCDSDEPSNTALVVRAFPASAGAALRAAIGRKVRLRVKVPAGAPPALPGGLPSDLAQRLGSRARDIIVDDEGLTFRVEPARRAPFWRDATRLETDPARLQGVLEDLCELSRLAGVADCQGGARRVTDLERRIADLERRIADRKPRG